MCASIWIFWRVYCLHEWLKLVATHPYCCKSFSTECACHSLEFIFWFMSSIPPCGWDLLGDLVFNLKILVQPGARGRTMYKEAVAIDQDSNPWFHNGEIRPAKNEKMQPPAAVILSPGWLERNFTGHRFICMLLPSNIRVEKGMWVTLNSGLCDIRSA